MSTNRERRIEEIFDASIALPDGEREAFLRGLSDDPELLGEVASLLAAHDASGPIARDPAGVFERESSRPRRIGPYRVVDELGRGGMGIVYLAERDDGQFRHRVAIKVIRVGDSPEVHARILAERQILAALDHPNIARLLDGGVTDAGAPYLVMEHVAGLPIHVYCERMRLGMEDRLRLFVQVARAVDHAHRNLVVHRDLKPSNILVTPNGTPKLLDFGIAKLLNPSLVGLPVAVTREEHRVLTPEYASPEQLRGEALSTATDVYSLGVVLYELLTGRRPYRADPCSLARLARVVCEEEPVRPSTRVSHAARPEGDDAPAFPIPAHRWARRLRGDLDAIVLKALRKEARERYGSAELLAQDLERHLSGRPVQAHQGRRGYVVRKFLLRHRLEVGAAALVALSLLGGAGSALWQAGIARRERDRAEAALAEASEVAGYLIGMFRSGDPLESEGGTVTAVDLLRRGERRVEQLSGRPHVQARLLEVMGQVDMSLGRYEEAERLVRRAVAVRTSAGDPDSALVGTLSQLAVVLRERGDYDAAYDALDRARELHLRLHGPEHPGHAETLILLSGVEVYRGDLEAADRLATEALELRRRTLGPDHPLALNALTLKGTLARRRGRREVAEALLREAVARRARDPDADPGQKATDLLHLADLLRSEGRRDEAERIYRDVAASLDGRPDLWVFHNWARSGRAAVLEDRGDVEEAIAERRSVVEDAASRFGPDHPRTWTARGSLATLLARAGREVEAEALFREIAAAHARYFGTAHSAYAGTLTGLAAVLAVRGRLDEADSLLAEAERIRTRAQNPRHPLVALTRRQRAEVAIRRGEFGRAESLLRDALEILLAYTGPGHPDVRHIHRTFAELYDAWGRPADAERHRRLAGS